MNEILDILAVILLLVFILLSVINTREGLLFGFLIKPIIDTAWDVNVIGFSVIEYFSLIYFIVALIIISSVSKTYRFNKKEILLWIGTNIGLYIWLLLDPLQNLSLLIKSSYYPISCFILPYYLIYSNSKKQRTLLRNLLLASLIVSLISLSQFFGLLSYDTIRLSKGLQRANGYFHDIVTVRMYIIQGLISLVYINYSNRFRLSPFYFYFILFVLVFASYTLYSKAMLAILVLGLLIFMFLDRANWIGLAVCTISLVLLSRYNTELQSETTVLFDREIAYTSGDLESEGQILSGRGGLWEHYLTTFRRGSYSEKILGFGVNDGRTHNEFLRILILSGFIGLLSFVIFMFKKVLAIRKNFFRSKLSLIQIFILAIIVLDSIGVVWGLYPFYIIFMFGLFHTITLEKVYFSNATVNTEIRIW